MSEIKFTPEEAKAAAEASDKAIDALRKPDHYHSDTVPPEPLSQDLQEVREQLPFAYIAYSDIQEQKGEKNLSVDKKFLEFIKNLNSNYTALFKDFVDNKELWTPEQFEKNMEFFKTNYSLPLTDTEAIQALTFLNKEQNPTPEMAQKKVEAWRNQATQWSCPEETSIISLARGGFTIKETAPSIKDAYNPDKGLCYENFKYLQSCDFPNDETKDEIRFMIPRLVPKSTNKTFEQQRNLIDEINQKIQQKCLEWNILLTMGEANQITNQILAHYNKTGERTPLNIDYVRTLTRDADSRHLSLDNFSSDGLYCDFWDNNDIAQDSGLGVFALGVEALCK